MRLPEAHRLHPLTPEARAREEEARAAFERLARLKAKGFAPGTRREEPPCDMCGCRGCRRGG